MSPVKRRIGLTVTVMIYLLGICLSMAQTATTGTIMGSASDPSGAAIAGATVAATNLATSQVRTTITDGGGAYEFRLLPPGTYTVEFSADGYANTKVRNVTVNVGDALAIRQVLNLGSPSDEILVQWQTSAVQSSASTAGTNVGESAVKSLPLSSRNYTQAVGLAAGVSGDVNNASNIGMNTQNVQVGGGSTSNYAMDGAPVASSTIGPITPLIPSPDAIQQFKVQPSLYDASGRYAGANINVFTKSGTGAFHGTFFEFVRNDIFNANDFFRNGSGLSRPVLKQNQFGITMGGPVKREKLFFFASYQGTRQRNGFSPAGFQPSVTLPPLPATRTAATIGSVFCGESGFFGGVKIACDGSNINPVALNVLNLKLPDGSYYIPGSNTGGFRTVPFSIPAQFREDQFLINTDYVVSSKNAVSQRFFYGHDPQLSSFPSGGFQGGIPGPQPLPGSELPGSPTNTVNGSINAVIKLVSTFSANWSNETRISGQHFLAKDTPAVPFSNQQAGIASLVPQINMIDNISISGLFGAMNNVWDYNSISQYQWSDQISWAHGKHTIRTGVEVERRQWNLTIISDARESLTFMSFADFLLGLPGCPPVAVTCSPANPIVNGISTNGSDFSNVYAAFGYVTSPNGINHAYRFDDYSSFVQDDFKLSSRLTLNLGLRWEYFSLMRDATGNNSTFWVSRAGAQAVLPAGGTFLGFVVPSNFQGELAPGVYRNTLETPLPGGAPLTNFAPRAGFAWQPLGNSRLVVRGGYGIFYDRPDIVYMTAHTIAAVPYATPVSETGEANYQASLAQPFLPMQVGWGSPRWVDFSTGASSNLYARAFSESFGTPVSQKWNLEAQQLLSSTWALMVGYAGERSTHLQNAARMINGAVLASPGNPVNGQITNTIENASLRVPYLGMAPNGVDSQNTEGMANYHSLQVTVKKHLSRGVQVQAAYTFSKTLTTMASGFMNSNDPLDAHQQYGPSSMARPQRFVVNYSWEVPYKGSGVRGRLLKGWSVSGVTTIQSGYPLTITDNRGGTIYGSPGISRAEFCPGWGVASTVTQGSLEDRLNGYFNTAAFCAPPVIGDGTGYGNSSVGMVHGPGQTNTDLALSKNIKIKESKLDLRMELFNAFNHPQFSNPDATVSDPTFGIITSTSVNPRLIQFGMRYSF